MTARIVTQDTRQPITAHFYWGNGVNGDTWRRPGFFGQLWEREAERDARTSLQHEPKESLAILRGATWEPLRAMRGPLVSGNPYARAAHFLRPIICTSIDDE